MRTEPMQSAPAHAARESKSHYMRYVQRSESRQLDNLIIHNLTPFTLRTQHGNPSRYAVRSTAYFTE